MSEQYPPQFQPAVPPPAPTRRRRWIPWVAYPAVFVAGNLFYAIGDGTDPTAASSTSGPTVTGSGPQPTVTVKVPGPTKTIPGPKTTVTAKPAEAAAAITEDGTYLVGTDIQPGTYRNGNEGNCYWARLSGTDGSLDSIIANSNGGNQVVTIKRSDKAFETARCGKWRKIR